MIFNSTGKSKTAFVDHNILDEGFVDIWKFHFDWKTRNIRLRLFDMIKAKAYDLKIIVTSKKEP